MSATIVRNVVGILLVLSFVLFALSNLQPSTTATTASASSSVIISKKAWASSPSAGGVLNDDDLELLNRINAEHSRGKDSAAAASATTTDANDEHDSDDENGDSIAIYINETLPAADANETVAENIHRVMANATLDTIVFRVSGAHYCTLVLLGYDECRDQLEAETESVADCIEKVGARKWAQALHPKCTQSAWWRRRGWRRTYFRVLSAADLKRERRRFAALPPPQDFIRQAQTLSSDARRSTKRNPYLRPWERPMANINTTGPLRTIPISTGGRAFPINFGHPGSLIFDLNGGGGGGDGGDGDDAVSESSDAAPSPPSSPPPPPRNSRRRDGRRQPPTTTPTRKYKFWSTSPLSPSWLGGRKNFPVVPRKNIRHKLLANEEYTLTQLYRHSWMAFDMWRGGADSQRHLEILSYGAVPFFPDLHFRCRSKFCLAGYPKKMMRAALALPGLEKWCRNKCQNTNLARGKAWINYWHKMDIDFDAWNATQYFALQERLLRFTQRHLSCAAIVSYVLRTVGVEEPRRVLIVIPEVVDFLALCIESGAADIGLNYTTNRHWTRGAGFKDQVPVSFVFPNFTGAKEFMVKNRVDPETMWPPWQRRVASSQSSSDSEGSGNKANLTFSEWEAFARQQQHATMYGSGMVWSGRNDPPPNPRLSKSDLQDRVLAREFDLVIFAALFVVRAGRFHSVVSDTLPLLADAKQAMPWRRVVFIDGDDSPLFHDKSSPDAPDLWGRDLEEMVRGGSPMFVREGYALLPEGAKERLPPS